MTRPLYQVLATTLEAAFNCERTGNENWYGRHLLMLTMLVKEHMPSGSGIDAGTSLVMEKQKTGELRFGTSFHHMTDAGMYDIWTSHEIIVTANLAHGFDLKITGRDHRGIKDYLADVFQQALLTPIDTEVLRYEPV